MRLLWFGDLAATGFGTVTSDTGRELVKLGCDVRFVSQNNFGELDEPFASRTLDMTSLILSAQGVEGAQAFIPNLLMGSASHLELANGEPWGDWKPDACILLGDFYALRIMANPHLDAFRSVPSFHYVPIEGTGLPPQWNILWSAIKPIAMTEFGADQIAEVVGYRPPMVYHGVDSETFHPITPRSPLNVVINDKPKTLTSRASCKVLLAGAQNYAQAIEAASKTWIVRTDRNMPRKGYPALLRAMEPVLAERPNTILYLHCASWDQGGNLWDSVSKMDPEVQGQVVIPDWGPLPREMLVALYNAADLYVSTSAEGFGLTIAEAIACGIPTVALDYSAVPEVVGPAGVLAPVGRVLDNEYAHHWALPDEKAFGEKVAYLLDHPHKRLAMGALGPRHVQRNFRWDVAAAQFLSIASKGLQEPRRAAMADERVMVAA